MLQMETTHTANNSYIATFVYSCWLTTIIYFVCFTAVLNISLIVTIQYRCVEVGVYIITFTIE